MVARLYFDFFLFFFTMQLSCALGLVSAAAVLAARPPEQKAPDTLTKRDPVSHQT